MAECSSVLASIVSRGSGSKRFVFLGGRNSMRAWRALLTLFSFGSFTIVVAAQEKAAVATPEVTYNKDVAPILQKHCVACHRPNDIAPMSLMTYEEVLPFARMIRESVVQRKMPPWHADPAFGEFTNDSRLTDQEISAIDAWVKNGTKRGKVEASSPDPVLTPGWHIKPDVVLTVPEFLVPKTMQDDYEYIYVPTNFTEDKWIQAAEVLPGDRRVVHHATVSVINASEVAKHLEQHAKTNEGEDQYHYRTGKVLHLRADAPVIDDGCAAPDGGGRRWGIRPDPHTTTHGDIRAIASKSAGKDLEQVAVIPAGLRRLALIPHRVVDSCCRSVSSSPTCCA